MIELDLTRLEAALRADAELCRKYEGLIRTYAAEGEQDMLRAARRAAEALGLSSEQNGAAAMDDDALASISGGTSLPRTDADFSLNRWLGELLREAMKKDSAKNKKLF